MPESPPAPSFVRMDYQPEAEGPLSDVRVLDLARLASGGHCSVVLADLGADVIKLERPRTGDELRGAVISGVAAYWVAYSRNKRSMVVDLKSDEGRQLLLDILPNYDALLENFRPGTLEELGIGPEVLLERHPGLVITRISGWGQSGPYAQRPGFGTLAEAVSGFMVRNGYADRPPVPAPTALADMVAGLYASSATIAAIHHSRRTGAGQVVDVSLFEPLVSIMGPDALLHQIGKLPVRGEGTRASSVKGIFECADGGWVAMSAATETIVQRLFEAIDRSDLAEDPMFASYQARLDHRDEINAIIGEWIHRAPRDEVLRHLNSHGVTVAPLYSMDDARRDPHFIAREVFVDLPGRAGEPETVATHNVVPKMSRTPSGIRRPAPMLGEHTREALLECGVEPDRIDQLFDEGVLEERR